MSQDYDGDFEEILFIAILLVSQAASHEELQELLKPRLQGLDCSSSTAEEFNSYTERVGLSMAQRALALYAFLLIRLGLPLDGLRESVVSSYLQSNIANAEVYEMPEYGNAYRRAEEWADSHPCRKTGVQ
jgi:hypothetical protein